MKHFAAITAVFCSAAISYAAPPVGADWDWQLSENISTPKGIQVFDTDPDSVTRKQVMALNKAGIYTICYVSVGTVENYRDDVHLFPAHLVGEIYGDWPDEKFLDIRDRNTIPSIMEKRFMDCALKGFQAVEPDNQDVYDNDSGFNITKKHTIAYLKLLAKYAHEMGLEIGQKNVPELTSALVGTMDFVITESCYQDDWCEEVSAYTNAGKPVFDAEYTDRRINWKRACAKAAQLNISMILKDRDLNIGRKTCP